jgi:hypothetical protein
MQQNKVVQYAYVFKISIIENEIISDFELLKRQFLLNLKINIFKKSMEDNNLHSFSKYIT